MLTVGPSVMRTTRRLPTETISVSAFLTLDGQGAPSYATPVDVEAHVVFDKGDGGRGGDNFVNTRDGSQVFAPLLLYVKGDAAYLPVEQDRIELASGGPVWIVAQRTEPRGLAFGRDMVDHARLRCRIE